MHAKIMKENTWIKVQSKLKQIKRYNENPKREKDKVQTLQAPPERSTGGEGGTVAPVALVALN